MTWIKTIPYAEATGALKKTYDRVAGPGNDVDNILTAHSLRPHTLLGHITLYKNVLHNTNNTLPKWYLEAIGVFVSFINRCTYCVEHHFAGLQRLVADEARSQQIRQAIEAGKPEGAFDGKFLTGLLYAGKLTQAPASLTEVDVEKLRGSGFSDGEILEINQVASYFNYANRTVLGLGVDLDGDILGLSPNDSSDPDNWSHS